MAPHFYILVLPVLIASVAQVGAGIFFLSKESISHTTVSLTVLCWTVGIYLFSFSMLYLADAPGQAIYWANIGVSATVFLAPAAYHFAVSVCQVYEKRWPLVWLGWLIAGTFVVLQTTNSIMFDSLYQYWFGYYPKYTVGAYIELTYFWGFMLLALFEFSLMLIKAKRNTRQYYRTRRFLVGYLVGSVAGVDILPMLGVEVYPFGYLILLGVVFWVMHTVIRYKLLDITPVLAANEIIETMIDPLLVCDRQDRIWVVNTAADNTFADGNSTLEKQSLQTIFEKQSYRKFNKLKAQGNFHNEEFELIMKSNKRVDFSLSLTHLYDPVLQNRIGYVIVSRDIHDYKTLERHLQNLATMLLYNPAPVFQFDKMANIIFSNYAAQKWLNHWGQKLPKPIRQLVEETVKTQSSHSYELSDMGQVCLFKAEYSVSEQHVNVYGVDITERKRWEQDVEAAARHDIVTDLPNRLAFEEILTHEFSKRREHHTDLALLMIDLDDFKTVNDSCGHPLGDQLLRKAGSRIAEALRDEDMVARIGGDEFMVLAFGLESAEQAGVVAERILKNFDSPIKIDGRDFFQNLSVGIATYPQAGRDMQTLMKNVDRAMFEAKHAGKHCYKFYSHDIQQLYDSRSRFRQAMAEALENEQMYLVFQPQYRLRDRKLIALEALIRFNHKEIDQKKTGEVIAASEQTGDVLRIDQWVMNAAVEQIRNWQFTQVSENLPRITVNVSSKRIAQQGFVEDIKAILDKTQIAGAKLELELTETTFMENFDHTLQLVRKLRSMGIRLAIDDFGTGYSSLQRLLHVPVDTLKIDERFVRDADSNKSNAAIVRAVIRLAHDMGCDVVAEGIETEEELDFLIKNGCGYGQGYFLSPPLSSLEITSKLVSSRE